MTRGPRLTLADVGTAVAVVIVLGLIALDCLSRFNKSGNLPYRGLPPGHFEGGR